MYAFSCIALNFYYYYNKTASAIDEYSKGERSLAAFTAQDRTEWSRVRQQYFQSGLNKDSLDILESALFHVGDSTGSP